MGKKKKKEFNDFRNNEKSPYKTIKTTLKSILRNKNEVQPCINELVFEINDIVIHSYQFIRLYILDCFSNNKDLPIINETFISYCIKTLGIRDNRGKKSKDILLLKNLRFFYENVYQPLLGIEPFSLKNKSFLIPYITTQVHTSLQNNIQERFIQHFLRFINKTTIDINCNKSILFDFKNNLLNLKNTDELFDVWKDKHLENILPKNIKKSIHYDVKVKPFDYLKGMLYMNSILEKEGHKLFQSLPLRNNIVSKHIILDTACIIDYFTPKVNKKGEKIKKGELLKSVKENQYEVWNNLLNLQHKVFRNKHYQFNYQIQTDGFSCCLLFIHKDLKDKKWGSKIPIIEENTYYNIEDLTKETLDALKDRTIIGCDPGKHSLVYMMDSKRNKLQYTASQRKVESYGKRNQRILLQEKKRNKIIDKETKLSFQNSKSVNIETFKLYLIEKHKFNKETINFYKKDIWRKMNFRQYSYSKKSIDNFLNKIKETFGENLLIGYGNWSRSSQMKYIMPTMNKGLRKLIHKKYDTITINECNTSKKCCDCFKDLSYYKNKEYKKEFRLLVCSNCVSCENKKTVFRTRDANSAINIMKLTQCWINNQSRPCEFQIKNSSFTISNKKEMEKVRQS